MATPIPEEPRIALPTAALLAAPIVAGGLLALGWWGAAALFERPDWARAGLSGAGLTVAVAVPISLLTLPWVPKPASTAGLVWMAGSMARLLVTAVVGFLLYSAPPNGWSEDLATGSASFLLAFATGFLVALLVEVALIARSVGRTGVR